MKRLAYSLIGIARLWIIGFSTFSENPFVREEGPAFGPEPVPVYIFLGLIPCFIGCCLAGWFLSGTSIPREGVPHRLIMTCIAGIFGIFIAAGLTFGIYGLRAWISPGPPLRNIND